MEQRLEVGGVGARARDERQREWMVRSDGVERREGMGPR
jgi:hypothetical protein